MAEDRENGGAVAAVGGPAKRLSPRQRLRRQSLARNKKKQWGPNGCCSCKGEASEEGCKGVKGLM